LRLGWESIEEIDENAAMAAEGGASWLTIHARTRVQGYAPPVYWPSIGKVRASLGIPVIANGDIWTYDDFLRCRDETGCQHFMIGRGALANPALPRIIAQELGIGSESLVGTDWPSQFRGLVQIMLQEDPESAKGCLMRLKQWIKIANLHGDFPSFDRLKTATTLEEFFGRLE